MYKIAAPIRWIGNAFPPNPLAGETPHRAASEPRWDAEYVIYRLEEAGSALLALPPTGYRTALSRCNLEVIRSATEGYGWTERRLRPPVPSPERITRMDEAMGWLALIPNDRYVLRRIVGARSLVSPFTERHLYAWRKIGELLGADHKAVQRWHAQGIDLIVAALSQAEGAPASRRTAGRARAATAAR